MKNIAIDVRSLMEEKLTGVGEYTFNLLKSLFSIDQQNQYYLFYNKREPYLKHINCLCQDNVTLCEFTYPNKLLNACIKIFKRPFLDSLILSKYNKKADVFFFPNINFLSISPIGKYIITAHDLSFKIFPYFYSLKRRIWHNSIDCRQIFKNAYKIIAVSENTKRDLIDLYNINPNKIKVIHSGVNINFSKDKKGQIKQKYNLPDKFILGLGTLEPRKNIESLIEAFALLKQKTNFPHKLVIAGAKGWKYNEIFNLIQKLKLENEIFFPGYIDIKDKPYIYNLADIFIYPSYYEGFGFPPLEAMACRTPVITSHTSSLTEICENTALFIDPYNINEIYWAIKEILSDNNLRANLIGKGSVQVQKFNWQQTAEKFLQTIID